MPNNSPHTSLTQQLFTKPVLVAFGLLIISILLFMSIHVSGNWSFVLALRGKKVLALLVVGYAIGTSTLLFQTITHNPILTPSLLGFDALYLLIQNILVFSLGVVSFTNINPLVKFAAEVGIMLVASLLLFHLLFSKIQQDLTRLILVGIIFGVLFRSLSSLVARLIDPTAFMVVQSVSFAQFTSINTHLLVTNAIICAVSAVLLWRWRYQCDVLLLGRESAIGLGVNYHAMILRLLTVIALLVATATAFVGPVVFLGLLVCAITNRVCMTMQHTERLVLVSLTAMISLVLGQVIFERILGLAGVLSVVIELVGGMVFLGLIYRHNVRKPHAHA